MIADEFMPSLGPEPDKGLPGWWFIFSGYKLLVYRDDHIPGVPFMADIGDLGLKKVREVYLGEFMGHPCRAVEVERTDYPVRGMVFRPLRSLFGSLGETLFRLAGLGMHLIEWDRTCLFCSSCGAGLKMREDMRAKECPECSRLVFPRISPAVIVAVEWDNRIVLARSAHFPEGVYSVIAGFVEPGETLEEAVRREVREEVGIEVADVRYFGSQPWPFPDSLMIAFTAQYVEGELRIDEKEIVDAKWFTVDDLPLIPNKASISRQLIDWFAAKHGTSILDKQQ